MSILSRSNSVRSTSPRPFGSPSPNRRLFVLLVFAALINGAILDASASAASWGRVELPIIGGSLASDEQLLARGRERNRLGLTPEHQAGLFGDARQREDRQLAAARVDHGQARAIG